jgi:DDE family transposase
VAAHLVGRRRRGEQVKGRWPAGAKSTAALASRTSPIYLRKMSIDVRLASGCLPLRVLRHVRNARSNLNARRGRRPRITRWEHEHLLEAVQQRLDGNPRAMRQRRETVEHPFGTIKARMGATHFLTKTLPKVAAEMALSVLAYNLARAITSSE